MAENDIFKVELKQKNETYLRERTMHCSIETNHFATILKLRKYKGHRLWIPKNICHKSLTCRKKEWKLSQNQTSVIAMFNSSGELKKLKSAIFQTKAKIKIYVRSCVLHTINIFYFCMSLFQSIIRCRHWFGHTVLL